MLRLHIAGPVHEFGIDADINGDLYLVGHPTLIDNEVALPDLEPTIETSNFLLSLKAMTDGERIKTEARKALRLDLTERLQTVRKLSTDLTFGSQKRVFRRTSGQARAHRSPHARVVFAGERGRDGASVGFDAVRGYPARARALDPQDAVRVSSCAQLPACAKGLLQPQRPRYRAGVPLRIWCDVKMSAADAARFAAQLAPHEVLWSEAAQAAAGLARQSSTRFEDADVAYGQPSVEQCLASARLSWVHLRSAGWDRFDLPRVRAHFAARRAMLTTSARVYSEPCAQHVLAFMLSEARQLPRSIRHQLTDQAWPQHETRAACTLLGPEATVVLVGFGNIATRPAELLAPFGARVVGVRRRPTGTEPVRTVAIAEAA